MLYNSLLGRIKAARLLKLVFGLHPHRELIVCDGQRLDRRRVFENLLALGGGLQSLGIKPGERVVSLLPACPAAVYALFLPGLIGSVHVPLNPLLSERELRLILSDCSASVVITSRLIHGRDFSALLERLRPELPALKVLIVTDLGTRAEQGVFKMDEIMAWQKRPTPVQYDGNAAAVILYTSGTTGEPKGVVHSLPWLFSLVRPGLDLSHTRSLLLPFPPYQVGGILGIAGALLGGGRIIMQQKFDPLGLLQLIQDEHVTQLAASPTMLRLMLRSLDRHSFDLASLRRVTTGSEPCPPDLAKTLSERFHCQVKNIYAASECLVISMTGRRDDWEIASRTVGKPAPGVKVRIVDEQRKPLPTGTCGEVAVCSSQLMLGYLNDPQATARVVDPAGWFYTGDIGVMDKDGRLSLVDRKKDVIIRGGQNIHPAEVEQWLMTLPAIRRVAVVGVPNPVSGEVVWAFIERQLGVELTARQVLDHCRGWIVPFKIPEQVRFLESLPMTSLGKIQKYVLREMARQEMEHG